MSKSPLLQNSLEPLTQSLAGPRDISLNVFEQGLKFAVLGLRIEEVSILRLEIVDLLATRDCTCKRFSLRCHAHNGEIPPAWRQTFKQLPHGHFFVIRFNEVRGAIFHFNERIGSPCMYEISENSEDRNRATDPSGVVATVILPTFSAR
jgi:hypothetical protein